MTGWARGREEIIGMIQRREPTQVVPDDRLAARMVEMARKHLASAEILAASDPHLAYSALHDAVRKALAALLQTQGLRATTTGGHLAVQHAAKAQFGSSMGGILRPVDRIRATRHESEYPTAGTWIDEDMVRDDLPAASAVVEAAEKALPHMPPFVI
ncbi:HEPN domain-containing protein [Planomonospora algeriensis]